MISTDYKSAGFAGKNPNGQRHLLPVSTTRTGHACVTCFLVDDLTASVSSYTRENQKETIPRNVGNRFGKVMVLHHPRDVQILNRDSIKPLDQFGGGFVVKMFARPLHLQMSERDNLTGFPAIARTLFLAAQTPLLLRQVLGSGFGESRVGDFFAVRQCRETLDAYIYGNRLAGLWQRFGFGNFADQQSKPAVSPLGGSQLFASPFNRTAQANATEAHAGNSELVAFERASALGFNLLAKRPVSVMPFEARKSGAFLPAVGFLLSIFAAFEKGRKRIIQSFQRVGLDRSQHCLDFRQFFAGFRQLARLLIKTNALAGLFVLADSLFKRTVVDKSAGIQRSFTRRHKLLVWANLKFVSANCGIFWFSCLRALSHTQSALWLELGECVKHSLNSLSIPHNHQTNSQFGRERASANLTETPSRTPFRPRRSIAPQGFTAVLGGRYRLLQGRELK